MIPIIVIWFGIGENSKYFLIFRGPFFFVLINAIAGVMRTPVARGRAAISLIADRQPATTTLQVPGSLTVPECSIAVDLWVGYP